MTNEPTDMPALGERAERAARAGDDVVGFVLSAAVSLVSAPHPAGVIPPGRVASARDDDDHLSGGALAVLLLAIGGAVAGVLY